MAAPSMAQGSMFEGLFVRALKPTGEFAAELLREGFDLAAVKPEYPTQIWVACLAVARRHAFGALADGPAYREIGKTFFTGFTGTLAGKLVMVALPFLSTEGILNRMPRYMTMGRSDVRLVMKKVGERHLVGELSDPYAVPPDFLAGILFSAMELSGAKPTIVTRPVGRNTSELDFTWT